MPDKPPLVERVRAQQVRHRQRSRLLRVPVAALGFTIVGVGLALLVLPGPGHPILLVGLAVIALEFAWAERVLERAIDRVERAREQATQASKAQKAAGLAAMSLGAAAMLGVVLVWDIPVLPF